ncbi:MAG: LysR substrate-binding domain-containing protein [Sphingobium sp.]
MEIAQLRTLIHVAELGSLSKAADRLGIAQPALSRQIRLLEAELKAPLFTRHGRGMLLTDLGRQILEPAGTILAKLDDIRQLSDQGRSSLTGRVRFGMTPTVAEVMTVPLAQAVRRAHPGLNLRITSAFSGHLLDWLKREELDCCVSYDPEATGAVRTQPILLESLLLVGNSDCALSMDRPVEFNSLEGQSLVLPSPHHGLRTIVENCAERAGIILCPGIETDAFGAMIDLVESGFGMTILPLAPIYDRITAGRLRAAPMVNPSPSRRVVMTYPADRPISPAARYTGEAFTRIAAELVERGIWTGRMLTEG